MQLCIVIEYCMSLCCAVFAWPVSQLQALFLPLKLAHLYLSQYNCREALRVLGALPASQRCSAGVLLLIGRCLYELVDYARAAEAFEAARAADPLNLEVIEGRQWLMHSNSSTTCLASSTWAACRMADVWPYLPYYEAFGACSSSTCWGSRRALQHWS